MASQRRGVIRTVWVLGTTMVLSAVPSDGYSAGMELGLEGGGSLSAPAFNCGLVTTLAKRAETHPLLGCRSHNGLSLGLLLGLLALLGRRKSQLS